MYTYYYVVVKATSWRVIKRLHYFEQFVIYVFGTKHIVDNGS